MKNKKYTSSQIKRACGFLIAIFSIIIFVSAFSKTTWGISFLFVYLFGLMSYWIFLPLVTFIGFMILFSGAKAKKILTWRILLGSEILLIGISFIFAYISASYYRDNSLSLIDMYGTFDSGLMGQFASMNGIFDLNNGGGIILTLLASLLNNAGDALTITLAVITILTGLFILFYPYIMRLIHTISMKISVSKAKKESDANLKRQEEEKRLALEKYIQENEPLENDEKMFETPALSYEVEPEELKEEIPSRTSIYHSNNVSEVSPVPQEIEPDSSFNENIIVQPQILDNGMHEAIFEPNDNAKVEPGKPIIKQEVKKEVQKPVDIQPEVKKPEYMPDFGEVILESDKEEQLHNIEKPQEKVANIPPIVEKEPLYEEKEENNDTFQEEQYADVKESNFQEENSIQSEPQPSFDEIVEKEPEETLVEEEEEAYETIEEEPIVQEPVKEPEEEKTPGAKYGARPAKERPSYEFPPLDLLKEYPVDPAAENQNKLLCQQRMELINQTLDNFHAGAHAISYTIGPSVTRYDIQVDAGVTVSSINKYVTDISARLGGLNARYEEIILGKTTSGLEIPNEKSTMVSFKDVISHLPQDPSKNMYIPFGVDISGNYISADLTAFPHMLVGGTSGSGKSVFAHGIIASLIMRNRPEDLKLVLVDPKRVEMTKYENIPHLLCPIIKEPSQAKVCLDKLIDVMEQRLVLFEFAGVRNIRDYNEKYCPKAGTEPIPFIVVFIDEYADLSDTCKNIGESVVRIAQKARAVGIHLIVATQRPSVNVITGVIKANLDTRVSLRVKTAQDSMTILTKAGAERLNGYGDMLVDCPKVSHGTFVRCQGCFIEDEELMAITDFIKAQQTVKYDPNFTDLSDHSNDSKIAEQNEKIERAAQREKEKGDLYETIKADIMLQEYTSISKIQRTYGVGFPRAGKIFQQLQKDGIVGVPDSQSSAKGARVLIHDPSMLSNGNERFQGDNDA